ncbi:ABC transporter ATP-binding protein [[Mycoplasma] cavipharyngis]|uniref:ATP-binding cassette domain-containing protein n=1 Tax=[Mycoplasma] cavipharyngis TaxID=92757 RepID=UPI003703E86B
MIKIINISKTINNNKILNKINLTIPDQKMFFIIGPSGIGKTTLLNIIGQIDQEYSGDIFYCNQSDQNKTKLKSAFIFQDFNLMNELNGIDNIKLVHNINGKQIDKQKIIDAAEIVGLNPKDLVKPVKFLSGGEKQRITILRSVLSETNVILADEPTGNLDQKNSDQIFQILKKISSKKTVIVVSHDLKAAQRYGDYIYNLANNELQTNKIDNQNNQITTLNLFDHKNDLKKHFKYKLAPLFKLVISDFHKKILALFTVIFSLFLSSLTFSFAFNFSNVSIATNAQNVLSANLDAGIISKNNISVDNDIDKIKKLSGIKEVIGDDNYGKILYVNHKSQKFKINYQTINSNLFFQERLNKLNIVGNKQLNDHQIIIGADIAKELNIIDPQNQEISIQYGRSASNSTKLQVVGINHSSNFSNHYDSFLINNSVQNIINLENPTMNVSDPNDPINNDSKINKVSATISAFYIQDNVVRSSGIVYNESYSLIDNNEVIIEGKKISNQNEILVPNNHNLKINQEYYLNVKTNNVDNAIVVKVVGKYQTNSTDKTNDPIKINQSLKNYLESSHLKNLRFYFDANLIKNLNQFQTNFQKQLKEISLFYQVSFNATEVIKTALNQNSITLTSLGYITFGLILLSIFSIITFGFLLSNSKIKEIGLLKSLGAKIKLIFSYHLGTF